MASTSLIPEYDVDGGYVLSDWSGGEDRPEWSVELRLACNEIVRLRKEFEEVRKNEGDAR